MTQTGILVLILLLQVKHLLADYMMQSGWMVANKGKYLHPGGLAHAGLHGGASLVVLLATGVDPIVALWIALAEIAIHYHIDFAKDRIQKIRTPDPHKREYWIWHGLDQFAHQVTMLGILACVLWFG